MLVHLQVLLAEGASGTGPARFEGALFLFYFKKSFMEKENNKFAMLRVILFHRLRVKKTGIMCHEKV